MRANRVLTGLLAGAVMVACGGGDGGTDNTDVPTPGNLTVTLAGSPPAGAGAVLLTISGGTNLMDTVVASGGYSAYVRRLSVGSFKVVLVGPVAAGALATVHVPDTRKASSYAVSVTSVANNSTYAVMNAGSFPISVVAP